MKGILRPRLRIHNLSLVANRKIIAEGPERLSKCQLLDRYRPIAVIPLALQPTLCYERLAGLSQAVNMKRPQAELASRLNVQEGVVEERYVFRIDIALTKSSRETRRIRLNHPEEMRRERPVKVVGKPAKSLPMNCV